MEKKETEKTTLSVFPFCFLSLQTKSKKKDDDIIHSLPRMGAAAERGGGGAIQFTEEEEKKSAPSTHQASSSLGFPPGTKTATLLPFNRIVSSFVSILPPLPSGADSTASSMTIFTKASNPRNVPSTSLSPFSKTQRRAPTHRSRSSEGRRWEGLAGVPAPALRGATMAIFALRFLRGGGLFWCLVGVEGEGRETGRERE